MVGKLRLLNERLHVSATDACGRPRSKLSPMDALDGNAIAGRLREVFGAELTNARSVCVHCGAEAYVAELHVYNRAPGTVVRCRRCEAVVMVLVEVRGITAVDCRGLELA